VSCPVVKLGDVVSFVGGSQPPKSTFIFEPKEGYVRLLQIRDYKSDKNLTYIKEDSTKKFCTKHDVMIGRYGPPVFQILKGLEGAYNVALMKAKPSGKVDSDYLYQFLKQDKLFRLIDGLSQRTAGQSGVDMDALKDYPMLLPSLNEQKRIAEILDKADAIRSKRQQATELADDFLRSVFLDMFGDPVTNPKGWEVQTIVGLASQEKHSIKRGPFGGALKKEIFVDKGYLVYEQYHALNNDFSFARYFIDEKKFQELKAFEVTPGEIIISCSGVNLGRLAIVPEGSPTGIINQALLKVKLNNTKMLNEMFISIFTHPNFKREFFGDNRGSGVPNFPPMSSFKEFGFIVPPIEEQLKFIAIVDSVKQLKLRITSSFELAKDEFNSLSQKAFAGEL
tara:strand:- start:17734 stop:18915 length:1182 start_codon:yes stop_codon:yes gene_type:complete